MASKSYWQEMYIGSDNAKVACMSWFGFVGKGYTPYEAAVLCDKATDREKKIRVRAINDETGQKCELVRTHGGKTYSISSRRIP